MNEVKKFLVYCWKDNSMPIAKWDAIKMVSGNKSVVDLAYEAMPASTLTYREVQARTSEDAIKYLKEVLGWNENSGTIKNR